ncbi:MAG: hypothetical protein DA443_07015 [Bacteroidetes bacterium]|nr:MAG: hypothetical protein DA443_07015 [Bacteroidota bacterium]
MTHLNRHQKNHQKNPVRIALVGLGPRGLGIVEQICMQSPAWPDQPFELLLLDPASFGEGCHQQHQPDHFLMNTAAEQLGWSAIRSENHKSFAQWIRENGLDAGSQNGAASQHVAGSQNGTDDASSATATPTSTTTAPSSAINSATPKNNSASHGYYARSMFGRYLRESLEQLLRDAPDHIHWQWIQQKVTGLQKNADGSWNLETPEELIEAVDYVHLCTGHGSAERPKNRKNSKARLRSQSNQDSQATQDSQASEDCQYTQGTMDSQDTNTGEINPSASPSFIEFIYPFDDHFASLASHQTVALEGMGLTAFDVVAELTEGRGGVFLPKGDNGLLEYVPSGREPSIIAYSRTGLPLKAKPKGQDQAHGKKVYKHLTDDVVRQLQSEAPVDFETQILPLVELELKQTYYDTYFQLHPELWKNLPAVHEGSANSGKSGNSAVLEDSTNSGNSVAPEDSTFSANVADQKSRLALMESMVPQQDRFSLDALLDPFSSFDMQTEETFRRSLENYLREDFLKAELGVAGSPEKAAMNTLRDIREQIAKLIDFKMLRGDSQQWLYHTYLPKIKWLSVGPPRSRIAEWLALSEAGVLTLNFGAAPECTAVDRGGVDRDGVDRDAAPSSGWILRSKTWPSYARHADTLIQARIQVSDEIGNQPLVRNLLEQGLARLFDNDGYRPGGLEVTHDFQIIGRNGKPIGNLWATGILTEGERFYTFSLPSPGKTSRFDADAKAAVESMFTTFGNHTHKAYEEPYEEPFKEPYDEQAEKIYNT